MWLARSVTGSLRAVKIVRRETFELERTFLREIEGIENFEPISRAHPGLVDIFHVGWNMDESFCYYVMELADDREHGSNINWSDYEPHTLTSARVHDSRLPLDRCIDTAISLADALAFLHQNDLIHRDIKPSNIIYVDGQAKLVDVGLVAATGQRTFVGTEGFVPPEGPGSPSADIYSLGMVLYEISTGMDRLQFPELPDEGFQRNELPKWQRLNAIICKACAPDARKRFASAHAMAEELRELRAGKKPKSGGIGKAIAWGVMASLALVGISLAIKQGKVPGISWHKRPSALPILEGGGEKPEPIENGAGPSDSEGDPEEVEISRTRSLYIRSLPAGATVLLNGSEVGKTELTYDLPYGKHEITLRQEHFDDAIVETNIGPGEGSLDIEAKLILSRGPKRGERWTNALGMAFRPMNDFHESDLPVGAKDFETVMGLGGEFGVFRIVDHPAIATTNDEANACAQKIAERDRRENFISEDFYYEVREVEREPPENAEQWRFFKLALKRYGTLDVKTFFTKADGEVSDLAGAMIWIDGKEQTSRTPFTVHNAREGSREIRIRLDGYKEATTTAVASAGQDVVVSIELAISDALIFGKPWTNSRGMKFVPVGDIMMSIYETRRREYDVFAFSERRERHHLAPNYFAQTPEHPVVGVNRDDAIAFCRWLTEREREAGLLPDGYVYRLPTDKEWSFAVGIAEEGAAPAARDNKPGVYPWGFQWPPKEGSGNFATRKSHMMRESVSGGAQTGSIPEFEDGRPEAFTCAVGQFDEENAFGLHDLAGNVREWVSDEYGGDNIKNKTDGVLRGGSWNSYQEVDLYSSARQKLPGEMRILGHLKWEHGFRCVLAEEEK